MTTPTPPTTTNITAEKVDQIIKTMDNRGVQAVEAMIITAQPWMGTPVWKQIWEMAFAYFASYFIQAEQQGVTFGVIDVQVSAEKMGLSKALANLMAAEKSGDLNAIKAAMQAYANTQSQLIHDDGSATAH